MTYSTLHTTNADNYHKELPEYYRNLSQNKEFFQTADYASSCVLAKSHVKSQELITCYAHVAAVESIGVF